MPGLAASTASRPTSAMVTRSPCWLRPVGALVSRARRCDPNRLGIQTTIGPQPWASKSPWRGAPPTACSFGRSGQPPGRDSRMRNGTHRPPRNRLWGSMRASTTRSGRARRSSGTCGSRRVASRVDDRDAMSQLDTAHEVGPRPEDGVDPHVDHRACEGGCSPRRSPNATSSPWRGSVPQPRCMVTKRRCRPSRWPAASDATAG